MTVGLPEGGVGEVCDEQELVVESFLGDGFESLLAAPGGPLGLGDGAVAGQVGRDGLEGDAPVGGDSFGGRAEPGRVDRVASVELHDVDIVAPAGAGDAAFEDGDALLGDGGLGGVAEDLDVVAEGAGDSDPLGGGHDGVTGGDVPDDGPSGGAESRLDADPEAGVVGVVADLVDVDAVGVELDPVVGLDGSMSRATCLRWAGGDGGADGLGVDVFGGASGSVDGQQDAAFEHESVGVGAVGESVEERFEEVAGEVLGEGGWSSVRPEVVAGEPG